MELKNRITMTPLFTAYANRDGTVSKLILDHYKEVARGGVGMIVVANALVDPSGTLSKHSLRVDDDRFLRGLSQLAETIKKAALQHRNWPRKFCEKREMMDIARSLMDEQLFEDARR